MKFITRKDHSRLDYIVGLGLILAPLLAWNSHGGASLWIPIGLGAATVVVSLCTKYEGGVLPVISFGTHLVIDVIQALILGSSPWIFGFNRITTYWPYVLLAIMELLVVTFTDNRRTRMSLNP